MSASLRTLVCAREPQTRWALSAILRGAGFAVETTTTASDACRRAALRPPDGAVVATALADGDGVELCRRLREWSAMPLILVSAAPDEDELVHGLQAGADHYLASPVGPGELVARLHATLRRVGHAETSTHHRVDDIDIDLATRTVRRAGEAVHLTPIEFRLLRALVLGRGRLLTHRTLLEHVWGPARVMDTQALRTHMVNLRRKIEPPDGRRLIRTEHGVGYRLAYDTPGGVGRTTPAVLRLIRSDEPSPEQRVARRHAA